MEDTDHKKPRERSKEYPQFTQKFCIEFTETINSKLGNRFSTAEQIAKTFNKAVTSIGSHLSSCKQYDLLELKKGQGYKPTEYFFKITRGKTEEDKRDALIQSLKSPSIYEDIIEKFSGQDIPSDLASIFYWDYSIKEGAKDAAAKIFTENLQNLNLISDEGKLTVSKSIIEDGVATPATPIVSPPVGVTPPTVIPTVTLPPSSGNKKSDIKVSTGRFVTLEFPFDITSDEIDRLIKNLELWKD